MQPIGSLRPRPNTPRFRDGLATTATESAARKSVRRAPLPMISGTPDRQDTRRMPPKDRYRIRGFLPDFDAVLRQIPWMPRSRNCMATGACIWFGVTIALSSQAAQRRPTLCKCETICAKPPR